MGERRFSVGRGPERKKRWAFGVEGDIFTVPHSEGMFMGTKVETEVG